MEKGKPVVYEDGLTRHMILYAKGHYGGKAQNIMDDLRILLTKWSGTLVCFYTDANIYSLVSEHFVDCCTKQQIKELFKCFYRRPYSQVGTTTLEDMVSHMIGLMGCIKIYDDEDGQKITLVDLGEKDLRYMITDAAVSTLAKITHMKGRITRSPHINHTKLREKITELELKLIDD